ncbi:methylated-DNA--protein-cysteine methyltransferase isoform A [Patagioenas fasciata monilis]|uniref:Methylated-DNA--protein-cysteine methyltransferase n=1 Tax=Patagioenas fasciata monilis TaxID=372326 RepID=A0A1V4KHU3_PATFA|nr:methylated-DNA--protein-cysteine methyltransferase isoform A [Patagioenas fasciata monilis]
MFSEKSAFLGTCVTRCWLRGRWAASPADRTAWRGLISGTRGRGGPWSPEPGPEQPSAGGGVSSTMASRLVPKAAAEEGGSGCMESHAVLLSPVGKLEILGCEMGLHEIKLPQPGTLPSSGAEPWAACELRGGAEELPEPLRQCAAWLCAYFCEPGRTASLPLPPFHHPLLRRDSFTRQVLWTLLRDVKFGEAVSYKQLADLAGNSRAARAVGGAMRSNPIPIMIPCHRVIRSSGQAGNYGGGHVLKEWLLSHEKLQKEKLAPCCSSANQPRHKTTATWLVTSSQSTRHNSEQKKKR